MDGFKNSTKTQYSHGGSAKIGKVMGEFKSGKLHSGSKKGPAVENPKQAIAIALSESRKAPMKKAKGGYIANEPTPFVASDDDTDTASMADSGRSSSPKTSAYQSFGEAFKAARASGKGTFTWHGKSYTTELSSSKPSAPAPRTNAVKPYSSEPIVKPAAKSAPAAKPSGREVFKKAFSESMEYGVKPDSYYKDKADARSAAVAEAAKKAIGAVRGASSQVSRDWDANKKRTFRENMRRQLSDGPGYAEGGSVKKADAKKPVTVSHQSEAKVTPKVAGYTNEAYAAKPPPKKPVDTLNGTYGYAKGGKVVEKGSKEVYASKAAMAKHEAKESKGQERKEHRKQMGGPVTLPEARVLASQTSGLQSMGGYSKGGMSKRVPR